MNTRLQVEHPVTECITGLDLVELMIRVAAGEALPFTQEQIPRKGWAIECRINAEDPFRNFLPSTGRLITFRPPPETLFAASVRPEVSKGNARVHPPFDTSGQSEQPPQDERDVGGVRVDTGVYEGGEIPMHYDSMIAKLIVHGRDRADAIAKMRAALNAFVIRGISSNVPFQSALLAHPKFVAGEFNTGFIAEHYGKGFSAADVLHDDLMFLVALAAFVRRKARERALGINGQVDGHRATNLPDLVVVVLKADGAHEHHPVHIEEFEPTAGKADVVIQGRHFAIQSTTRFGDTLMTGTCNGKPFTAQVECGGERLPLAIRVAHNGTAIQTLVLLPRAAELMKLMPHKAPPDLSKFLLSPMPGLLADITVQPGQKVVAGERLAVIEAMKMENILTATQDGTVKEVLAKKGESVAVDQPIVSFA
jgi:propionyl-CoA carboxylase alpha chain